jgi:aldehyde dehydrogenase (NAD+)
MLIHEHLFIGGGPQTPEGDGRIEVVSPVTEQVIGRVPAASAADADRAVDAARAAFDRGPWPLLDVSERMDHVRRFAAAIRERGDDLADVLCAEVGLPRHTLPAGQIAKTDATFTAFLDLAADHPWEETRTGSAGRSLRVRRLPVGVVAAIVPWNAPLLVSAMKLAPALIAGATVILKPAVESPLHTYLLAEAATAAGLPAGVLNILPADAEVSEYLVRHPGVDKISFTGSTAVGRRVGAVCGAEMKRCTLELGGKSASIVLDDFELSPPHVRSLVTGAMVNSGQVCAALSRVLVPRRRYKEVVDAMAETVAALVVGDPGDPSTDIGPLVSRRQRDRVERYLRIGREEGATPVVGGGRADIERGWYVQPTVFSGVDNRMTIAREEIFGPVAAVIPYDGEDEAVALANDSEYGLAGAVWTADAERGERVAGRVRSGAVAVNAPGALDPLGPFGGLKQSGMGREGGHEGIAAYTEYQTILLPAR